MRWLTTYAMAGVRDEIHIPFLMCNSISKGTKTLQTLLSNLWHIIAVMDGGKVEFRILFSIGIGTYGKILMSKRPVLILFSTI